MPKITVILPVYNSQEFIEQCLNSIVNQTLKDIEIICINDFSLDNSWNVVKSFAQNDSRFVLIENSENKKQGYCRNLGVVKAKSPYIHFIDSDDWINDLDFYRNIYEEIEKSDVDICVFNYYEYHNDLNILVKDEKNKRFPFLYDKYKMDTSLKVKASEIILSGMAWDKVYKKDFLINNNIVFAEGVYWEDILFNFLLKISSPKIRITDKKYIVYRLNAEKSTTTNVLGIYKDSIRMAYISKEMLEKNSLIKKYKKEFIENYLCTIYFDILCRVKEKSYLKFLLMKNDIKKFFNSLNLTSNDLEMYRNYNEGLCDVLQELMKSNLYIDLFKYIIRLIFSVRNTDNKKFKIVTILGIKFKFRRGNA